MKVKFTWEKDSVGYHAFAVVLNQKILLFGSNDKDFFFNEYGKLNVTVEYRRVE